MDEDEVRPDDRLRAGHDYLRKSSMLRRLLEFRQEWLYFRKCGGISLRQVRRDLIARYQDFMKQVAECRVLRATRNLLSLIKNLP